jgi:hypothetical protein
MAKKDPIDVRRNDAAIDGYRQGYDRGVQAVLEIVIKHFANDWNGELAIREIKKLQERK